LPPFFANLSILSSALPLFNLFFKAEALFQRPMANSPPSKKPDPSLQLTSSALKYYNAFTRRRRRTMRTTIELSDDHRSALHSLAARRGLRGYSKLIQEAIDFYIKEKVKKEGGMKQLLKMKGTWSEEEARKLRKRIEEIRRNWKMS
jgi:hypothetical protein